MTHGPSPAGEKLQGEGLTRLLEEGALLERGGVGFSHVRGPVLPPSATQHRPELAGAHIMQPSIRDYYHLEEIWGDKPVKMKLDGEAKGLVKAEARPAAQKAGAKTAAAKTAPKRAAPKKAAPTKKRVAAKTPAKAAPRKGVSRTVGVKKAPAKKTTSAPRRGR